MSLDGELTEGMELCVMSRRHALLGGGYGLRSVKVIRATRTQVITTDRRGETRWRRSDGRKVGVKDDAELVEWTGELREKARKQQALERVSSAIYKFERTERPKRRKMSVEDLEVAAAALTRAVESVGGK